MGLLTKKEREFIEDWFKVLKGEMEKIEFYDKWSTRKDDSNFLDDLELVRKGEMSLEEFRSKWSNRGDWKNYIRVMRSRLKKKFKEGKKDLILLKEFLSLRDLP